MSNNEIRELTPSDSNNSSPNETRKTYYPTQKEMFDYLNNAETNFVFLFGRQKAGKTAVLCGLHQAVNRQNAEIGKFEVNKTHYKSEYDNPTNAREYFAAKEYGASQLSEKMLDNFKDGTGFLLERTNAESFYPIKGTFTPSIGKKNKSLDITFLELAGEDLEKIKKDGGLSQYPAHIEMFFKVPDLPLCFILMTPWEEAPKDDLLIADFIDYIIQTNKTFNKQVKFILLLTCWDTYDKKMTVEEYVDKNMPKTSKHLERDKKHIISNYSLGNVTLMEKVVGEAEVSHLSKFEPSYSSNLWYELYKTFTGKDIQKSSKSWLGRLGL